MNRARTRTLPIGAELVDGDAHFRVWAPRRRRVEVISDRDPLALTEEGDGYFSGFMPDVAAGFRYRFRLDGAGAFPDPASRWQPDGPHGESVVVDPRAFEWTDDDWRGIGTTGQILYEMHVGTFTRDGTFAAAARELESLADLGITTIELLPLADFSGSFGWGYDGVSFFAPYHGYGNPDAVRAFVNRAHALGLGVLLDVVYNHFGPDGNYLGEFSDAYVSDRHTTDWGQALNFDGPQSGPVREFILCNARHWISEYHFDGLRLDATHSIRDNSTPHILRELGEVARDAAGRRDVVMVAENEPQDPGLVRSTDDGGCGLDLIWCDDFHHSAIVASGGKREAYFMDYRGTAQELVSAVKHGILYQGQHYRWQKQRRGRGAWDVPRHQAVFYIENHDQVANSRDGRRLHHLTGPGRYRALSALLLLAPQTPMLFQGQEFGTSSRFLYFADHGPELAALVREGRAEFLSQFESIRHEGRAMLPDPAARGTFEQSQLDHGERSLNVQHYALYRDLIELRRCDPVISSLHSECDVDGATLSEHAFVIRYFGRDGDHRLLVVNLDRDLHLDVVPEPLLAPPDRAGWERLWHSEDEAYGGRGAPPLEAEDGSWRIPAESATLLSYDAPGRDA